MENLREDISDLLISLGICSRESIVPYYPSTRDRPEIPVYRCTRSGVIFLKSSSHIGGDYYESREAFTYWSAADRREAVAESFADDSRRAGQFGEMIANRRWLDIGTGAGQLLELLAPRAKEAAAVEPQQAIRDVLGKPPYSFAVYKSIDEMQGANFDVVTMFHVLEHLTDPVETLRKVKALFARSGGGELVVEVPHARDFLLDCLDLESFKKFTLWSEHLILHTRESLRAVLAAAGFGEIVIKGFQRYPLSNHLLWLKEGRPGGHREWAHLNTPELTAAYSSLLSTLDQCDTLIAVAKPEAR